MFNQVSKLAKGIITLALAGLMVVGCAADMGEVDLVQPDYIKKSDLLGKTWYYRRTVVDAPETQSPSRPPGSREAPWLSIGTGDLFTIQRIKFDIQEKMIVGYSDYEWVEGSEEGNDEGSIFTEYGNPIVAFPITKHFDIARKYDSSTGQPSNVISENASDNEWFDRDYIRVNWAANILGHNPFIINVSFLPVTSSRWLGENQSPANPYRARMTPEKGYFDITTAHTMIPDWWQCLYGYGFSWFSCGSGEARIRHSFMELNEEEAAGYEVLNYPDSIPVVDDSGNEIVDAETGEVRRSKVWERFGYYRLERFTYDNYRALTESGRVNNIIRFNIWEKSVDADGVTIPYAARTPKPIIYYLNWDFPANLLDTAKEVAAEWNGVYKRTVASLQDKSESEVPDMFILKENTCSINGVNSYLSAHTKLKKDVNGAVPSALSDTTLINYCAALEYFSQAAGLADPFTWQQNGDVRFNMLYWITQKSPSAFAGYGPMLGDPVTGLNVVATANVVGWTIDSAAARARDYIDYVNGDLTLENLLAGNHKPNLMNSPEYMPGENINNPMSMEEMNEMARKMASHEHIASLEARFQGLGEGKDELLNGIDNSEHFEERLARVQDTPFEREHLMRTEDLVIGSQGRWAPGDVITDEVLQQASPIRNMRIQKVKREGFQRKMEERTFCPMANFDDALVGLAEQLKDLTSEERFQILRQKIFKAVALHEIGHNVGLRHNFEASFDALNYDKTFWELETSGASETEKLEQSQPEFKYSSIMDYHGKINGDFHGLGLYDEAAVKFGYGQILEVFNDTTLDSGKNLRKWNFINDYKKLPAHLTSVDKMYDRTDTVWDWTDTDKRTEAVVDAIEGKEVPYLFCSDEYAGRTPTCNRFDFGANQRELQAARYTRYKNYFIFSNYLNGRIELPYWQLMGRSYRYFREIVTTYQYMYLYRSLQDEMFDGTNFFGTDLGQDMATAVGEGFNMMAEVIAMPEPGRYYRCVQEDTTEPDFGQVYYYPSWLVSYSSLEQEDLINHIGYGLDREICNRADLNSDGTTDDSEVLALGDAQPLFLDFTDDFVTWGWEYVGTYWDKMYAIREMTDPWARFFRVNRQEDRRMYSVSPIRLYNKEIMAMMSGIISYDRKSLASGFDVDESKVIPKSIVDLQRPLDGAHIPAEGESSPMIIPSLARNLQRTAMLYGMALLTSPLDNTLDFAKHTRVVLAGGMDDVGAFEGTSTDGLAISSCTVPVSGMTYRAKQNRDGFNIGYDMVQECADAAEYLNNQDNDYDYIRQAYDAWQAAKNDFENNGNGTQTDVDVLRRAYQDLYRPWSRARSTLTVTEQLLNYTRLVHLIYEHGAEL